MSEIWYYQYEVTLWNSEKCKEEIQAGIVPGTSFSDAMQKLENYYSSDILNVTALKAISEGEVFEFEYANESNDFDYEITEKE